LNKIAPIAVVKAGGIARRPILTGSGSYTDVKVTGKKLRMLLSHKFNVKRGWSRSANSEENVPEEIHAGCKGHNVGKAYDALALEKLTRHHRVRRKFPFPDHPGSNEGDPEEGSTQNVCTAPCMGIAAGIEGNKAVSSQNGERGSLNMDLQESQAHH
jgi:hypothetical protein